MKRFAFTMRIKPGKKAEYKRRHEEIWPEIVELLRNAGVSDYSIFLEDSTNTLFAVQKISGDAGSQDLGQTAVVQKWWAYMADIMETNPDNSPITTVIEEVFHMD